MARGYPRFLFSDPQNTKSKGPFVIHMMKPMLAFRVAKCPNREPGRMTHNGKYILFFLDEDIKYTEKVKHAIDAMFKWIEAQEKAGAITVPLHPY